MVTTVLFIWYSTDTCLKQSILNLLKVFVDVSIAR